MDPSQFDHERHTVGGYAGYWVRRCIHIGMITTPLVYYYWGSALGDFFKTTPQTLLLILVGIVVLIDMVRLSFGKVIFGQRAHEARQISSLTWGAIAVAVVLLFAPSSAVGIPIIVSCAIGDPVIGELRRRQSRRWVTVFCGLLVVLAVWWLCALVWPTPWWLALIMAPVTVAAEWPSVQWIDDNALMQLVPLLIYFVLVACGWGIPYFW